ncbi:50S ribosomal protein L25/general stress protein Ctc [Anaerobacillus alkalilacustris]|uniref:Large ribosomal subunit protein bL25 n=1 Tax=Anaerobacillus alkalilacustris TaxID=393763 RepID=A0A1S2LYI5_9BACI|nr:50S ribosomal protein L25/general stress protein Ctc [Anaerobacillus alkalilacustris]OIJ17548.1 50S ribosomal protein L25/general stress protein Ctc [Anaerobacillus alkalilacustris]
MGTMLKASNRDELKGSELRALRKEGNVPAVVYGKGLPSEVIFVNGIDFLKTIKVTGKNGIIFLATDSGTHEVIANDIQVDDLKGDLIHVDFYKVNMKEKMDANVPVHLVGEAAGIADGGIIQQTLYEVSVRSLPADIPEAIEVDITHMMIGDSLQVRDLPVSNKYEINNEPEEGIMSILAPTLANEPDEQQEKADKEEVQAEAENSAQEE